MTPNEYQKLAERTECNQFNSMERMASTKHPLPIRLNHSIIGLAGEVGELAAALQRWIYYGKPLDATNFKEEFGDCLWYIAEGLNALGLNMEDIMEANIAKLKARYPEKYTDYHAAEENRDRAKERNIILRGKDWRIGLRVKPKFTSHNLYYVDDNIRVVVMVHPNGYNGIDDPDGVLELIKPNDNGVEDHLYEGASIWMTAE